MPNATNDKDLREVFLKPIRKCAKYKPALGQGRTTGIGVREFQALYGSDPFYKWLGLDTNTVYAAHKAAGGLTSVYRQIGIGSERLFRKVMSDSLGLTEEQMKWSYEYSKADGKSGVHTLDACIRLDDLNAERHTVVAKWLATARGSIAGDKSPNGVTGSVFEVRQGYKSADSKRQNADLRYGIRAYQARLLPVFAIMSAQVSDPVLRRYRSDGMLVLTGVLSEDPTVSTFAFFEQVIGYDLAAFFERNCGGIQSEMNEIVGALLRP